MFLCDNNITIVMSWTLILTSQMTTIPKLWNNIKFRYYIINITIWILRELISCFVSYIRNINFVINFKNCICPKLQWKWFFQDRWELFDVLYSLSLVDCVFVYVLVKHFDLSMSSSIFYKQNCNCDHRKRHVNFWWEHNYFFLLTN